MTTPQTAGAPTLKDAIRQAGGIVHSDGNIFFTSADQMLAAIRALSAPGGEVELPKALGRGLYLTVMGEWVSADEFTSEQMRTYGDARADAAAAHWKANHQDVLNRLRLATQRDDLPVDRLPAIQELEAAQATLRGLGYTKVQGAARWRPPIGPSPEPLLARIAELEQQLVKAQSAAQHEADVVDAAKERIAELEKDLRFVERWATHHAAKPTMTPEQALSMIQNYPAILDITKGYSADNDAMDNRGENG